MESAAVHRHGGDSRPRERQWYVFSSHGIVLLYIALNPDCAIGDIAEALFLTRRTVWGIIGDLRKGDMVHVRRDGRRHHYTLNFEGRLRHPIFRGYSVGAVLRLLVERIPSYLAEGRP